MGFLSPFSTPRRYIMLVVVTVISVHYILHTSSSMDGQTSPLGSLKKKFQAPVQAQSNTTISNSTVNSYRPTATQPSLNNTPVSLDGKANATFVFLARNDDLDGVVSSVQNMEDRFNRKYHYPWVFLNDEPFTEDFKQRVSILTDAPVSFGLIPRTHWVQPDWIDEDRARMGRLKMMGQRIIYGGGTYSRVVGMQFLISDWDLLGSVPYRNMCRFNSGFFFKHELLQPYRYYWRVEPNVKFFCDIQYDPFVWMESHDKVYGFTISLEEHEPTVPTLWASVKEFMSQYPHLIEPDNSMNFLSDDKGEKYNLCHYWSNFEIADMDFWRGQAYTQFFEFLDAKGGFYYERWGDAPVHSIAASLFARRDQIHFFRDIGYRHENFQHCPSGAQWSAGRCACDSSDSFDYTDHSCLRRFENLFQ
ncbi:Glycosyltransferase family 15 protein [Mycena sanguinolenta]|uniref:Glycosyltransferase family 15 protein n=1 Tax=Mycena sanguinolenta TaxID=230812 RepID=A0A8H7D5W7_9AGAR|nr:Glycosyltransferase family 15 protein [Mycena sanguinolenta]